MALTFLQLKTRVALALQDPSHIYWTAGSPTAEIDSYLNDGLLVFSQQTECMRAISTLVASNFDPAKPYAYWQSPLPYIPIAWYDVWNAGKPLDKSTTRDEMRRADGWDDLTGTPQRYITGLGGKNSLRLVPDPNEDLPSLRAEVSYLPVAMIIDGLAPEIPDDYHQYLVDYAVAQALSRDGEKQDLDEAARRMGIFMGAVMDCKAAVSKDYSHAERAVFSEYF